MLTTYPKDKVTIVGGGFISLLTALYITLDYIKGGNRKRITIIEKNKMLSQTTASLGAPSLTFNEILAVVPSAEKFLKLLKISINEKTGIKVNDVPGINDSNLTQAFIHHVLEFSKDTEGIKDRTKQLLELGKFSMALWNELYIDGDEELRNILIKANFNPCMETDDNSLHKGYRIDAMYNITNAKQLAENSRELYHSLGYRNSKLLTPDEVFKIDPYLAEFCSKNSKNNIWNDDAAVLWRPGGCIDTNVLLPDLQKYIENRLGTYTNNEGVEHPCFTMKFEKEVNQLLYNKLGNRVIGLGMFCRQSSQQISKFSHYNYDKEDYILAPGEAVGTLKKLGLKEPASARFAGVSTILTIPLDIEMLEKYKALNHYMEVYQEGVCLTWQARCIDTKLLIRVAGTKAFYGDQEPNSEHQFAKIRHLLQLNMIKDIYPSLISGVLKKDVLSVSLTKDDLKNLQEQKIGEFYVGSRSCTYDNVPTIGYVFNDKGKVDNTTTITHLGSGGISFGPAVIKANRWFSGEEKSNVDKKLVEYCSSSRTLKM